MGVLLLVAIGLVAWTTVIVLAVAVCAQAGRADREIEAAGRLRLVR